MLTSQTSPQAHIVCTQQTISCNTFDCHAHHPLEQYQWGLQILIICYVQVYDMGSGLH